jgi:CRISPR-associated protein Cmr5
MSNHNTSRKQMLDQERAQATYKNVTAVDQHPKVKLKSRYSALARKAPAMIQTNGLGQALAFLRAKDGGEKNSADWMLYDHISTWVMDRMGQDPAGNLLEWIIRKESSTYRRATNEAMAFLSWLKRWAEAILPEPEEEG